MILPFSTLVRRRRAVAASSLIPTMLIIAVIMTFLSIAVVMTTQSSRFAGRQQGASDVMTAADSALEFAYSAWVASSRTRGGKAPDDTLLAAITETSFKTAHPEFSTSGSLGVSIDTLRIAHLNPNGSVYKTTDPDPSVTVQNVPGYPGWTGTTNYYKAEVIASLGSHYGIDANTKSTVHAARYFQLTLVPLFQNAIFYQGVLELNPGADMIVKGKVHSNKDIWAQGLPASGSSVLLQFMSNVSYVSTFNEVANPAATQGWDGYGYKMFPPSTEKNTWSDGLTTGSSLTHDSQINKVSLIDPFGGASTNNNGLHDMIEVPSSGSSTATSSQVEYNQASLRVTIDSSKTPNAVATLLDANGLALPVGSLLPAYSVSDGRTTITSPTPAQSIDNSVPLTSTDLTNIKAALTIGTSLPDWREGVTTPVTVDSLDMVAFNSATSATASQISKGTATKLQTNFNGALYIHDVSTKGKTAIRLKNGRTIANDLTVASDNGVYVQGDFNTGGTGPSDVDSNKSNDDGQAAHVAKNYAEASVAIMADAVTILSNNWNDGNASKSLTSRVATPTTVNAAIVAGDVPTNLNGNGIASGGAHNFPRFLEYWAGVNFTYWGSLVEAYNSEKFTGTWQTNQTYYWPERKWNFDTNLLANPPPFSPQGILYSRGRWERVAGAFTLPTS